MKILLSSDQINLLPVHDAELHAFQVHTSLNGETTVKMTLEVDPEESLEPFRKIGINTRLVDLYFERCFQVVTNILSYQTRREQILDWRVVPNSERVKAIIDTWGTLPREPVHNVFEMTAGSKIEVMAELINIEDCK